MYLTQWKQHLFDWNFGIISQLNISITPWPFIYHWTGHFVHNLLIKYLLDLLALLRFPQEIGKNELMDSWAVLRDPCSFLQQITWTQQTCDYNLRSRKYRAFPTAWEGSIIIWGTHAENKIILKYLLFHNKEK